MKNANIIKSFILSSLLALSASALAQVPAPDSNINTTTNPNMVNPVSPVTPQANPNNTTVGTPVGINPTTNGQNGSNSCTAGSPNCLCPVGSTTNCKTTTAVTPVMP